MPDRSPEPDGRAPGLRGRAGVLALVLALAVCALAPGPAAAQAWFTKEFCRVTSPDADPQTIDSALVAPIEAEAARTENGTGRLWRVTSPEGAVSHLWGTMHSTDPLILNLPAELRRVLALARFVAPEYNPIFPSREKFEETMRGAGFYRGAEAPMEFGGIDARILPWIEARLDSMGWGAQTLPFLTEFGLASILLADPCDDFAYGILPLQDQRVQLLGLDAGAEIVGLEPWDALPETLGRAERRETALAIIELSGLALSPEVPQQARRTVFGLYLQGRIGAMMALERRNAEAFFGPSKADRLLGLVDGYLVHERNRNFLRMAVPLLSEGDAVIAVGAFHLPGEKGLVSLLRREGFRVDRVRTRGEVAG